MNPIDARSCFSRLALSSQQLLSVCVLATASSSQALTPPKYLEIPVFEASLA